VNSWAARVKQRAFLGDAVEYHLDWDGRELVALHPIGDMFEEHETVHVTIEPKHCVFLDEVPG
jgi:hypothetical protein